MSVKTLAARLQYAGGDQLGRMNKQKLRSLQWALKNDYNTRFIETPFKGVWPCLINTNNLKPDYDKKIVSVEFGSGLEPGDVFRVLDNDTYWMIYLPILTETAYLQSEIIRCRYQLEVDGEKFWIYFQGPTETDLRWFQKNQINANELNLSGTIYIKNTEKTKEFFKRFTRVKLDGHVWEVQVTDSISVPGIIELEVQEYYDNTIEELPEIIKEDCKAQIIGKTIVKQDTIVGYEIGDDYYNEDYEWSILDNPRVEIEEVLNNGKFCKVKIHDGAIRTYRVKYGNDKFGYTLEATIDISEPEIKGDQEVFPYDTKEYYVVNRTGTFYMSAREPAKIIEQSGSRCTVEVISGKSGYFILHFKDEKTEESFNLPVQIRSF